MALLAAAAEHDHTGILCLILLIATIIALVIGLAEALGLYSFGGPRVGNGRFGTLLLAIVLLIVYVFVC